MPPDVGLLRLVCESIDDLILVKDRESKILWANAAFREWYGMSNEELRHQVDSATSHPVDTLQYLKDDLEVCRTLRTLDVPTEAVTRRDGEVRFFHTRKNPLLAEDGTLLGTVGVSRRIHGPAGTAQGAERRDPLKQALSELKILVRSLPAMVAMSDARVNLVAASDTWNDTFGHLFDHSLGDEEGLARSPAADLVGTIRALGLTNEVSAALHYGRVSQVPALHLRGAGGGELTVQVDVRPWRWADAAIGGVILQATDVTARMRAEQSLARAYDELAHFNYRVSHDLVAPLRTAKGLLKILQSQHEEPGSTAASGAVHGDPGGSHPDLLHLLDQSLASLDRTLSNVVDLARADIEAKPIAEFDASELVEECLRSFQPRLDSAGIVVEMDVAPVSIAAERNRLAQVLDHLIDNALAYADPAKTDRWLRITSRLEESDLVLFVVDNGIGLPADPEFDLFAPFARGTSSHSGSGLGLYLVRKHIDALGGEIAAGCEATHTTFRVSVPSRGFDSPTSTTTP